MGHALWWIALGYASCVWDCASSPSDPRWPSATGGCVVLMALRVPRWGLWGAALCGLVLDAAHGGPLGPRVLAGVLVTALVSQAHLDRAETSWPRALGVFLAAMALWSMAPFAATVGAVVSVPIRVLQAQSLALSTISSTLIVMALWRLTRSQGVAARD